LFHTTNNAARRVLLGGGWFGGPGTESILSANDAVGAIENAVSADNFGAT
jgi:hypothetical protein